MRNKQFLYTALNILGQLTKFFAHSGELSPSVKALSDNSPVLSMLSVTFFSFSQFLDLRVAEVPLFWLPTKKNVLTNK